MDAWKLINLKPHQLFRQSYPATVRKHHSYQNLYPPVSYLDLLYRTSRNYLPFQDSKAVMIPLMAFILFILSSEVLRYLDIFFLSAYVLRSESRGTLALLVSCSSTCRR